jgi:hypothetical protein
VAAAESLCRECTSFRIDENTARNGETGGEHEDIVMEEIGNGKVRYGKN